DRVAGTAVLEYRPGRDPTAPWREVAGLCASLPTAPPQAACKPAETRALLETEAKPGETRTVCWREVDSNFWFRARDYPSRASVPHGLGPKRGGDGGERVMW